ncbi:Pleckstriny-like domain family B member [Echinococcus granulosus]|uniref:Pleckstriny-like domain family B member n=1 Tax=Echinococcus granulosus TaxID=6210 RepID=W6UD79_ECHGR|nr:Pleckstriny-like domain family B member [Echinococcus granulosus]EUB58771.1 Pleckstriny-like domain family B member [Echinococcus granulosus]
MAATFKPRLELDLSDAGSQGQNHHSRYCGGYQCIKTNGTLARSFSAEDGQMAIASRGSKVEHNKEDDVDDASPQLEDVEALLRGYSHSHKADDEDEELEEGDAANAGDEDEDDDDNAMNGSSPILLSECPEFQAYLQPLQVSSQEGDPTLNDADEIVFGFVPRKNGKLSPRNKDEKDEEGALWELIEAEAEALCLSEQGLACCQRNAVIQSPVKRTSSHKFSKGAKQLTTGGVAALMNCAATEMSRLRVGAAVVRRAQSIEASRSPETPPTPPSPPSPPPKPKVPTQLRAQQRQEKTRSTTGTLASLLHIQLAQINRMSEAVRIEGRLLRMSYSLSGVKANKWAKAVLLLEKQFSNQLAHERALLELLELEHNRVRSEVKIAERKYGSAPSDLVNQLRHLKERLEQQKTLIDDLEYQYLEDKTKYEEEKESLMAQLKLQEETSTEGSPVITTPEKAKSTVLREKSPEDAYTYPTAAFPSNRPLPNSSPIYSSPAKDSPVHFCGGSLDPMNNDHRGDHFFVDNVNSSNCNSVMNGVPPPLEEDSNRVAKPDSRITDCSRDDDFAHFPPSLISTGSPMRHPRSNLAVMDYKISLPTNTAPVFHQQNGCSFDETHFSERENFTGSPQTSSSLPGGLNPHVAATSSNSSLLPIGNELHQSSCTSSSNNIFHAVPPLFPSTNLRGDQQQWIREESLPIHCSDEVYIRHRQRTSSVATRKIWQDGEARPLTRYLPVPDDISFDLRHHLEVTCGHILCSPLLMPHLHVDATTCAGYLYKVDSRVTSAPTTNNADNSLLEGLSSDISTVSSSTFFSPATRRARQRAPRVTSPSGGFMAALFHRSRRGKRRWFVLDRRRRLLIYYSSHTSKSSNAASLMKPKDVISFTDIIDVYPDQRARKSNNTSFCLLLVASCPPPPSLASPQSRPQPTRTRILSLAAPSPEAMRVWVDALFTCAGAYLCLPNSHRSRHSGVDGER